MGDSQVHELVLLARDGDQTAWSGLVKRFAPLVYSVARRHGLNAATCADVSQTTWLRLAENLTRVREPERVGGWLATTARNESLKVIRGAKREVVTTSTEEWLPSEEDPTRPFIDNERASVVWDAIEQLTQQCQMLLRLLFGEPPLDYSEIAVALDMPIGSIGPTRARCLAKARSILGSNYDSA